MPDPIPRGPFDQGLFLTHFNKGREAFEARRFEEAERQLEEAYLLRPRDVRVLNLLGLVYFRSDKLDKAEEVYRKLIAQSPEAHTLHYNLGLICFKLSRLEDAEQAFRKALELSEGNPKIHFYLGSIYERLQRYKDAIYHYRQAGANLMVQRLQGKLGVAGPPPPSPDSTAPSGLTPPPPRLGADALPLPGASPEAAAEASPFDGEKVLQAVSPALLTRHGLADTARFKVLDQTLPHGARVAAALATPRPAPASEVFHALERGLVEVDFTGKVYIKQGTIYSYSGNLTFWVKDKRPGARPSLVIVTGTGRLLLTDHEREITLMQVVSGETVFVEPGHLLACEEGLEPRYERIGGDDESAVVELVALAGSGMVALSVASKPLPLTVRSGLPVSVPAASVIMWTGSLRPYVVDDPQVYEVVLPSAASGGRLLRLEGSGRVLVEQASA
ncbi:MAG: tetratricopeptide repeat protein [Betaproteobacteria bacterium]